MKRSPVVRNSNAEAQGSTPHHDLVRAAFTPVLTGCGVQVYSWGVSVCGVLTLQSTTSLTQGDDYGEVAASMLPRNAPITLFGDGTGGNHVFIEGYTGPDFAGNPYGVLNIATTAAGTDFSDLSLFAPYNAYFITAAPYGPEESVPD
jgi:hypothetical protein